MWARIGMAFRDVARPRWMQMSAVEDAAGLWLPRSNDRVCPDGPPLRSGDHEPGHLSGRSQCLDGLDVLQLLLGIPVRVTPAIFAYSMLYPYGDNCLDDPAIPNGIVRNQILEMML